MGTASLSIGIVEYMHAAYGSSSRRLKFATTDARAFADYLRSAFGDAQSHRLLEDQDAVLHNVQGELAKIAEGGPLELFVLYLAGHGELGDARGGWFCLADAIPSERSLDGEALEAVLQLVPAQLVLVIVDCCHSEALVAGMRYFGSLHDSRARLFIASARKDQLAWEDEHLRRSILSDVLLRACSTTSLLQNSSGLVNVESALFPYLREQIPLLAAAQKRGAMQEPVSGGSARDDITLPVVTSKSFGRTLTIAQTVRGRLRQVLVKGAVAIVMWVLICEMLIYHVTVDSNGHIVVRPGLATTHALLPVALVRDTDTGLRIDQLSHSEQRGAEDIARSQVWGVVSRLDSSGIKPWFAQIVPLLTPEQRFRQELLAIAHIAKPLSDVFPAPIDETLFLSALRNQRPVTVARELYPERSWDTLKCVVTKGFISLDVSLINEPLGAYTRDLEWQSLLARGDVAASESAVQTAVSNTGYRLRWADKVELPVTDMEALALSLAALKPFISPSESLRNALVADLDSACQSQAAMALRILGSDKDGSRAEDALL